MEKTEKRAPPKKVRKTPTVREEMASKSPADPYDPKAIIQIGAAAKLIGVTPTRLRQLVDEGRIERPRQGYVFLGSAIQGHSPQLREAAEMARKNTTLDASRDAKTRETEIKIAQRMRDLIPIEDAMAGFDALVAKVNSELIGLPARVTRDKIMRKQIEGEVDGSRHRIADALGKAGKTLVEGGDILEALAESKS